MCWQWSDHGTTRSDGSQLFNLLRIVASGWEAVNSHRCVFLKPRRLAGPTRATWNEVIGRPPRPGSAGDPDAGVAGVPVQEVEGAPLAGPPAVS